MCRAVRCWCGLWTWTGCGRHTDVLLRFAEEERCPGHRESAEAVRVGGLLRMGGGDRMPTTPKNPNQDPTQDPTRDPSQDPTQDPNQPQPQPGR